jgi:signal transduction histidine kinase
MSHEIRTPIKGIVGFFDLLSKTKLDDTQKRYISLIQNSIETLMSIINDILDMAKIEAGKMEIEYFNVNPFVELDRAITLFAPKARQKGLKYLYSIDPKIY